MVRPSRREQVSRHTFLSRGAVWEYASASLECLERGRREKWNKQQNHLDLTILQEQRQAILIFWRKKTGAFVARRPPGEKQGGAGGGASSGPWQDPVGWELSVPRNQWQLAEQTTRWVNRRNLFSFEVNISNEKKGRWLHCLGGFSALEEVHKMIE